MTEEKPSAHIPNTSQPPPYLRASKEGLLLAVLSVLLLSDNDTAFLQKKNKKTTVCKLEKHTDIWQRILK